MSHYTDVITAVGAGEFGMMPGMPQQQQGGQAGNISSILSSLANLGGGIYGAVTTKQDEDAFKKSDASNLEAAKAADIRAANAEGVAAYAESVAQLAASKNDPNAAQDAARAQSARTTANQASQASQLAGAGLSPASQQARIAAINDFAMKKADASLKAAEESSSNPKDVAKAEAARKAFLEATAASLIAARVTSGQFMMQQLSPQQIAEQKRRFDALRAQQGGNFLTQKFGPLPVWGWGLVGTTIAGGAYYFLKMRKGA